MFILGIVLAIATIIYLLATNDERNAIIVFAFCSIAYLFFGYGIAISEIGNLFQQVGTLSILSKFIVIITVFFLIERFEETVFTDDYYLILRAFFYRFETIIIALYLLGVLFSTGSFYLDFLILLAALRLFKIDRFVAYITTCAVLFTNSLFKYSLVNINYLVENGLSSNDLMFDNYLVVIVMLIMMLMLLFAGYLNRRLEKDIAMDWKLPLIILLISGIGFIGAKSFTPSQMLVYLPVIGVILLYLNDLKARKLFSRFKTYPLTLSLVLFISFIGTIILSQYSLLLFGICGILLNSLLMNENYAAKKILFDDVSTKKNVYLLAGIIIFMTVVANYSIYNTTEMGISFVDYNLPRLLSGINDLSVRTIDLYSMAPFFEIDAPIKLPTTLEIAHLRYLVMAIPAVVVLSVPMQLLILNATGYKTKISLEMMFGVIFIGIIILTFISYGMGA